MASLYSIVAGWFSGSDKEPRPSTLEKGTKRRKKKKRKTKKKKQSNEPDTIEVIDSSEDEEYCTVPDEVPISPSYSEPTLLSRTIYLKWASFGERVFLQDFLKLEYKRWAPQCCLSLSSESVGEGDSLVSIPRKSSLEDILTFTGVDTNSPEPFVVLKVIK